MHSAPEAVPGTNDLAPAFSGRRVLLTGHTGFKGGWLALWLRQLGAEVQGVSLPAEEPSFFDAVGLGSLVQHRIADIRDPAALAAATRDFDGDLLIHMAAQPIVRVSFAEPVETLQTNVIGTANVLELARRMPSLRGIVIVTSDKCYQNSASARPHLEEDNLGGDDPYSASKACAEIVASAWRHSFFRDPDAPLLATVRAGNVFGGGDWARDRIVPDLVRAAISGIPARIRNPHSIRPWQHVLEPLCGYLQVAAMLLAGDRQAEGAWNFGPDSSGFIDVRSISEMFSAAWGPDWQNAEFGRVDSDPPELQVLRLDSSKAQSALGWRPRLSMVEAIELTVEWYRAFVQQGDLRALSVAQLDAYTKLMNVPPGTQQGEETLACA